jgi:ABC-2 type transport system permease protein
MKNMWTIARREFIAYFSSPIAYVAISVFLVVVGILFFVKEDFFTAGEASMRTFFVWVPRVLAFYLPVVAMRLVSEEKRSGTFELLATLPVTDLEIVLGKFLGAMGFLLVTLAMTLLYPIMVGALGDPDWGAVVGGYIGLLLVGATFVAIGLMASTWTRTQVVAAIVGVVISALFFFVGDLLELFWEGAKGVAAYVSFDMHFTNFTRGVADTRDIIFFLAMTALFLVVGTFSLNSRRWG